MQDCMGKGCEGIGVGVCGFGLGLLELYDRCLELVAVTFSVCRCPQTIAVTGVLHKVRDMNICSP